MKQQTRFFLVKAKESLADAQGILGGGITQQAARCAYMAVFHAAQAYIFELTNRVMKTHNGVQTEFFRLVKDQDSTLREAAIYLHQSYNYKATADYEVGPTAQISLTQATEAVRQATTVLNVISECLPRD